MPAMVRYPAHQRAFDGERARERQCDLERAIGDEASMREESVVPRGDAETTHDVEANEQRQVHGAHLPPPESDDDEHYRDQGPDHDDTGDAPRRPPPEGSGRGIVTL